MADGDVIALESTIDWTSPMAIPFIEVDVRDDSIRHGQDGCPDIHPPEVARREEIVVYRGSVKGRSDKKGNVGMGLGKGADVTMAVNKAVNRAKKNMVNVPIIKDTIPHAVWHKMGAARIMLKPAQRGRGVIAGGVTRIMLELAGVKNVTSKALGSKNKINNARCTLEALRALRRPDKAETKEAKAEVKAEIKKE